MRQLQRSLLMVLIGLSSMVIMQSGHASSLCQGKFANPITDVCWSCLFPITIGDVAVLSGDQKDTSNPSFPICTCPIAPVGVRIGISVGFWEPIALVDVTRHPYCMVNLGGLQLTQGRFGADGYVGSSDSAQGTVFIMFIGTNSRCYFGLMY